MESVSKALVRRPSTAWILTALWIGAVFLHYFSWKAAFDLSFVKDLYSPLGQADFHKWVSNWLGFLKNLSCAFAVLFILWRLGRRLLKWMGLEITHLALRFCLEMALGILLLDAFWLGWGFNGLWFKPLLWATALALLGWSLLDCRGDFLKIQKPPKFRLPPGFFLGVGFLGLMVWLLDLSQGMAPDVYFDALVYHLSTLQFWIFHHGITDFYTNLYSYFPFSGELYFFNGFFPAGSEAAKLLNVFVAMFLSLAVGGWVSEEKGAEAGWLAGTMVLALPVVSPAVWTTQIDVLLAFFLFLFFYSLWRWREDPQVRPWALLAGLLGGGALSIKYTAVIGLAAGLLSLFWVHGTKAFPPKRRMGLLWMGLLALIFLLPWFLKNEAFTGNGFYPYFSAILGGESLPPEKMKALLMDQRGALGEFPSVGGWVRQIFTRDLDKTLAPLLLGFIPFLFWRRGLDPCTRFLTAFSGLYLLSGFSISHQLRLMIPAFAVCFAAMGMILGDIGKRPASYLWGAALSLFTFLSLLSLCRLSANYYQTQKMWLGAETRQEYLAHCPQTESYYGLVRAASLLPPDARLLVVGDARSLDYPRPFLANSVFDRQVLSQFAEERKDGEGIRKGLREMGVDALAVSGEEGMRVWGTSFLRASKVEDEKKLQDFLGFWLDAVVLDGPEQIYELRSSPREHPWPLPWPLRPPLNTPAS